MKVVIYQKPSGEMTDYKPGKQYVTLNDPDSNKMVTLVVQILPPDAIAMEVQAP